MILASKTRMWILTCLFGLLLAHPICTEALVPAHRSPAPDRVYLNPAAGRFWTMDSFDGVQSEPLSLHKYLYAHCDPVNGRDPSGQSNFVELLTVMAKQAGLAAIRIVRLKRAVDKAYGPFVMALVLANLSYAATDDTIPVVVAYPAIAYNTKLLLDFRKRSRNLKANTLRRLEALRKFVQGGIGGARFYKNKDVKMKPTGFPQFLPHHLAGGEAAAAADVFTGGITKLKNQTFIFYLGNREKDYKQADLQTLYFRKLVAMAGQKTTWHHHECIGIMQLVQDKYHARGSAAHFGGANIYSLLTEKPYP